MAKFLFAATYLVALIALTVQFCSTPLTWSGALCGIVVVVLLQRKSQLQQLLWEKNDPRDDWFDAD